MSSSVFALQVSPSVPPALQRLDDLAKNFWFSWNPALGQLFRKLDPMLWRKVEGSPRLFLRSVDQSILDHAAADPTLHRANIGGSSRRSTSTSAARPRRRRGSSAGDLIAYFCAEYGWHESFPIYSGGLGVLAGDHCKTASDLSLPFVAVGFLYRHGYFHQRIDRSGQQLPDYPPIDPRSAPLVDRAESRRLRSARELPRARSNRRVRVWKAPVGRVTVLLLDTDVPENVAEDRLITGKLYGGSDELRQQQEAVLGIGGVRALRALGLEPDGLAHQRGPRGVPDPRAHARVHDGRLAVRGCARSDGRRIPCSRRTRPSAPATTCSRPNAWRGSSRAFPRRSASRPSSCSSSAARPSAPDVFNMTRLALRGSRGRQRRQQDSRPGVVAACARACGPTCRRRRTPSAS